MPLTTVSKVKSATSRQADRTAATRPRRPMA
jgi:hypothetical protein